MKAIKRLFTRSIYTPANQLVQQYTSTLKLSSSQQLSNQYQPLLTITLSKCQKPSQFLNQLLKLLKNIDNHSTTLKLLTLIHNFIIEREYVRDDIQELQEFDMHEIKDNKQDKWFVQFVRSYITYLMKLPSQADVYTQIIKKQYTIQPKFHLTHIFRLTNTIRVLFPAVTNAVNVIGRYQAIKHHAMRQLFMILSGQLVKVYSYIKFLCDQILKQYRVYNPKDLKCFLEILPELELLCDKIQDLLVNKYLKGKKINIKIEFKEERVAQLQYYLEYQYIDVNVQNKKGLINQIKCKV